MYSPLYYSHSSVVTFLSICKAYTDVNITKIDSTIGLYIEEFAEICLFHTEWNLVTYINITKFEYDYTSISEMVQSDKTLFSQVAEYLDAMVNSQVQNASQISTTNTIEQLEKMLDSISEHRTKWFTVNFGKKREKRGLINSIGEASKYLFGTLSEEDAQFYLNEFKSLKDKHVLQDSIIKKHTSIMESTINLIKNDILNTNETIQTLRKEIWKQIQIQERRYQLFRPQLNEILNHITLSIFQLIDNQKLLLNAIALKQNSMNNPNLLPPKRFHAELNKIRRIINDKGLDLPLSPAAENLATFYHISTSVSRIVNNQVIICLTLPLINTKKFNVFRPKYTNCFVKPPKFH